MKMPKIMMRRTKNKMTIRAMRYQCETCGEERRMWLQTGLEEPNSPHSKPVPFIASCPVCGGCFKHVRWNEDIFLPAPVPIAGQMNYFERRKGCEHGIAVFATERSA